MGVQVYDLGRVSETDDPFGLHQPITLGDLERIEAALKNGDVEGEEAERLRSIYDTTMAEFRAKVLSGLAPLHHRLQEIAAGFVLALTRQAIPKPLLLGGPVDVVQPSPVFPPIAEPVAVESLPVRLESLTVEQTATLGEILNVMSAVSTLLHEQARDNRRTFWLSVVAIVVSTVLGVVALIL